MPAGLCGQSSGPVTPGLADAIRDTLSRPSPSRGFTLGDALSVPVELAVLPVELAVGGLAEAVGWAASLGTYRPAAEAWNAVRAAGFRPSLTTDLGSRSGAGMVLGWAGLAPLRLETGVSVRGYQRHGIEVVAGRGDWTLDARLGYRRYTREAFWGVGMDAPEEARADFLEDTWAAHASLARAVHDRWTITVGGGWEERTVGAGRDPATPDVPDRYTPDELPGLGRTRFAVVRAGVGYDGRGWDGLWRRGVLARIGGELHGGLDGTPADFGAWEAEAEALFPITSHQHLTLRGRGRAVMGGEGEVPFTRLPALGGGATLRSYEWGRFRDRTVVAGSVEWRWELWRDLRERGRIHALLFLDRAAAAPAFSNLAEARTSVGIGLGGRWLRDVRAAAWMAFGEEGARLSGFIGAGIP